MKMILLENYKYGIEKLREHLHEAIKCQDAEIILNISMELDKLIVEYMREITEK